MAKFLAYFKRVWNPPRDVWFVRTLLLGCVWIFAVLGCATYWVLEPLRLARARHALELAMAEPEEGEPAAAEHGKEEPGKEEHAKAEHGKEAEGGGVKLGGASIPKSILRRRTGQMQPGHDLTDPEIKTTRGLASVLENDLKVEREHRFVELPEIMSGTRVGNVFSGKLMANVTVEVDSLEAGREIEERKLELQSLVSSLVSERQRDALLADGGIDALKSDIQREINHLLKSGRVTDVLFTNLYIM